jgi:hypothetical protein
MWHTIVLEVMTMDDNKKQTQEPHKETPAHKQLEEDANNEAGKAGRAEQNYDRNHDKFTK